MLSKNALCSTVVYSTQLNMLSHDNVLLYTSLSLLDNHSRTMIFENESDISRGVGPTKVSGRVETPAPILSSIIFSSTLGTLSSVARIVRRTICGRG